MSEYQRMTARMLTIMVATLVVAITMFTELSLWNSHCENLHVNLNYTVSQKKKLCQCYFLNNSVKHWPILIIFHTQHHEEN